MRTQTIALAAAGVGAATLLAACGTPSLGASWIALGVDGTGQAEGTVTLADSVPDILDGGGDRTPGGVNTTASIKANAEYIGGNWRINGSWKDGAVRFTFSGWALGSELLTLYSKGNLDAPAARGQAVQFASAQHQRNGSSWVKGGCMAFASFYRSTNPAYPGTGVVNMVLCDNGPGAGTAFVEEGWSGPDTVELSIPDTTDPNPSPSSAAPIYDNSPYRWYRSGGTMKNSGITIKSRYNISPPSTTVSPPYPSPTSTSSSAPPAPPS